MKLPPLEMPAIKSGPADQVWSRMHARFWFYVAWLSNDLPEHPTGGPHVPTINPTR